MTIEDKISATLNSFSLKIFQILSKNRSENFFISPYSISTALSMSYAGAKNQTASQIKKLLCLEHLNDVEIIELNKNFIFSLNDLRNEISLNTANKIYPQTGCNIKQEFIDLLAKNFFSEVQELNFSQNEESVKIINEWVSEKTVNKINNLLDSSLLSGDTKLVLVNAIYFKGNWLNKFDSSETYEDEFHLDDGSMQKVEMMKLLDKKFVFKMNPGNLEANSCEFPYSGNSISMTIILPHENASIVKIESDLNHDILKEVISHVPHQGKVHVYLPKFKIDFKSDVKKELKELGVTAPFSSLEAEFSEMTDDWQGLFISDFIHQAVVEVNEEGTEAAAATAQTFSTRMALIEFPPVEFKCNRSFLFIIHEKINGGVLFMGKYIKPV